MISTLSIAIYLVHYKSLTKCGYQEMQRQWRNISTLYQDKVELFIENDNGRRRPVVSTLVDRTLLTV